MPDYSSCDVFLSHSSKGKAVVRPLAERLQQEGLKVSFNDRALKPGDSTPERIDSPSLGSFCEIST